MDGTYLSSYPDSGLYVMQGRLSPPEDSRFQSFPRRHWKDEIDLAPKVPLRGIEWIFDAYGEDANPLTTAEGRDDLRRRLEQRGVRVASICADYFMEHPLIGAAPMETGDRIAKLDWLISICQDLAIRRIVLPFVDAASISERIEAEQALRALHAVLPRASECNVELHLETDMSPLDFKAFLAEIVHPAIRVNYDSGNSGSLGYAPAAEFAAYGDRIGSFHVKDRVRGGGTVPLGKGDVDFSTLRHCLKEVDYQGDFVMQVARGIPGDELRWLSRNAAIVVRWLRGEAAID